MKKHKTELRDQKYKRSYCMQPGCKFNGERAQQGVCFAVLDKTEAAYLSRLEARAEQAVADMKITLEDETDKHKIKYLYDMYATMWLNHEHMLDELVKLRGENSLLRKKTGKKTRP